MIRTEDLARLYIGMSMFRRIKLSSLYESMGVSSEVISSADYLASVYLSDFRERKFGYGIHSYNFTVNGRDCDFFKKVDILTIFSNSPYESYGPCSEFLDESGFDGDGYVIKMKIMLYGDPSEFKDILFEEMGHEIAHAYDDYNELIGTGRKYSRFRDDTFRDLGKMNACMLDFSDDDKRRFGLLLHMIDEVETAGYQHEIASEIMHADVSCNDMNSVLMNTFVMRRLKESETYINDIEHSGDAVFMDKILSIFNDIYGKDLDYGKMISFIRHRFMKVRKKILQAAGGAFAAMIEMRLNYRNEHRP